MPATLAGMAYDYEPAPVTPGPTYYGQPPAPRPPQKKRGGMSTLAALVLAGVVGVGGCLVGYAAGSTDPNPTSDSTKDAADAGGGAANKKTDPNVVQDQGVLVVGRDIQAGTYRTTVPTDETACYWARLKGTTGNPNEIITNGIGQPGDKLTITIPKTDKAFQTQGCGTWTKTS